MTERQEKMRIVRTKLAALYQEHREKQTAQGGPSKELDEQMYAKLDEINDEYGDILVSCVMLTMMPKEFRPAAFTSMVDAINIDYRNAKLN
jgi:hypothetical protein